MNVLTSNVAEGENRCGRHTTYEVASALGSAGHESRCRRGTESIELDLPDFAVLWVVEAIDRLPEFGASLRCDRPVSTGESNPSLWIKTKVTTNDDDDLDDEDEEREDGDWEECSIARISNVSGIQAFESSRAITDRLHLDIQPIEHRQIQIRDWRLIRIADVPAGTNRAARAARKHCRQVVMLV